MYQDCVKRLLCYSFLRFGNFRFADSTKQGEYKQFPGMFPHAAGKIASNGPYASVRDIYSIKGITENDKRLFKMYEKEFTANPPGRSFSERINNRVST
jgi:photosystem II PsbU protein